MKKSLKGSALMWTVCIMAVSLILITGVLSVAQIYHSRTIDDTKKQQALYSAQSAVSLVSDDLCRTENHTEWLNMLWDDNLNKPSDIKYTIDNLQFDNADMGTVNLIFEWNTAEADKFPYAMTVTAVSDYYDAEQKVSANFTFDSDKNWVFINYCGQESDD